MVSSTFSHKSSEDGAISMDLIVQTPKNELPPCTLRCRARERLSCDLESLNFFAVIDGFYSALVLGKGEGEFHIGFRPGDWDAVERSYKTGQNMKADMYPMGQEIESALEPEALTVTPKENTLQERFYPRLAELKTNLQSLDLEQNGKIELACFYSAISSCNGVSLTNEEVTEIFRSIDAHSAGFIYFEDITDIMDLPNLPACLQKFLRILGIEPRIEAAAEEEDVVEMDCEELREFVSEVVKASTNDLTNQLTTNAEMLQQVQHFQLTTQDELRKLIAQEIAKQKHSAHDVEKSQCKMCIIS